MNDLNFKNQRMKARRNDLLNKQRKLLKKKPRKIKKKENLKTLKGAFKYTDQLFSQFYKPDVREGPGRLRAKGKQGVEGMFFKGLCSEHITRNRLNEANITRNNEDINRIIDLRRVFLHSRQSLGVPLQRTSVFSDNQRSEISPSYSRNVSDDSNEDLEGCLLSPISFAFTLEESYIEDSNLKNIKNRKLDLEKEFDILVSKYEETVGAHVLCKLPRKGVLEDAIEALRKMQKIGLTDSKKDESGAKESINEFNFLTQNFEPEVPVREDLTDNFLFPEKFLIPEKRFFNCKNFKERSLENFFLMTDLESENYNHSSLMPIFENDGESKNLNVHGIQGKDFEKRAKDLSIVSPPIQFYRRNMF